MPETIAQANESAGQTAVDQPVTAAPGKIPVTPSMIVMVSVIVILLLLLIVMKVQKTQAPPKDPLLATLTAELESLKSRSLTIGMPSVGGGEQIDDVASRMKKDAESVVLLAGRYKQLLEESNSKLAERNSELLSARQFGLGLSNELARRNNELQLAKSGGADAEALRQDVAKLKAELDARMAEITSLKKQVADAGEQVSKTDMETLQRRYEETLRAKEFFESRAKELESKLPK